MKWQIKTDVKGYYISTTWLETISIFETMVFRVKKGKTDWSGILATRTKSKKQAIANHCQAISSYAKNA